MIIDKELQKRSNGKCELCLSSNNLQSYEIPPAYNNTVEQLVLLCETCTSQISDKCEIDVNHWRCLNESIWSEYPCIQVMSWRVLKKLINEDWAQNLIEQMYMEESTLKWAMSFSSLNDDNIANENNCKDSNGTILLDGDSVTLIKDLVVKGANFTAKRGITVKNISLTNNPEHIEGRVNGTKIVLLTCFLKKVN